MSDVSPCPYCPTKRCTCDEREPGVLLHFDDCPLRSGDGPNLDVEPYVKLLAAASSGPWKWWTSNSWRRLRDANDETVICPRVDRADNHPNLTVSEEDMAFIEAGPAMVAALIAEVRRLRSEAARPDPVPDAIRRFGADELKPVPEGFRRCTCGDLVSTSPYVEPHERAPRTAEASPEPEEWADRATPEDVAIKRAFPTRSGRHDLYQEAMRMVGARHSKGALVALVTWLLLRTEEAIILGDDFPEWDADVKKGRFEQRRERSTRGEVQIAEEALAAEARRERAQGEYHAQVSRKGDPK